MKEAIQWTATEAVHRLRQGDVTPAELVEAAAARIAEVEPAVNALPTLCIERALDAARALTVPDEPEPGHLFGLPIAIKDLTAVAGVRTTMGSPIFADNVPERSDLMVERLESRGALVVAKANTPEFGAGAQTFNEVFGTTRNPWNTAKTPGGSSGGSAVAVATGEVWLAQGSDLGGSLRIPASFSGCVGLRPSPGRVAHGPGTMPFAPNSVEGPMARTVADVALFLDAMAGMHRHDPISLPAPARSFQQALADAHHPRRVAFSMDLGISPIHPDVRRGTEAAMRAFGAMGCEVVPLTVEFSDAEPIFQTLRAAQFAALHAPKLETHRDKLKPEVIWNIEKGLALTADDIGRAEHARADLYHRFAAAFDDVDLVVTPTVNTPPFDAETRYLEELDGQPFESYISWLVMTFAITLTTCPAISVPCGFTPDGLPLGLQLVGPPRGEAALLGFAHRIEQAMGGERWRPVDPVVEAAA
ncbi:MAG: amidase family protein [Pseudomonadota bacterium]|nr:amidase family protein [Pseudomonadota bacterium]